MERKEFEKLYCTRYCIKKVIKDSDGEDMVTYGYYCKDDLGRYNVPASAIEECDNSGIGYMSTGDCDTKCEYELGICNFYYITLVGDTNYNDNAQSLRLVLR